MIRASLTEHPQRPLPELRWVDARHGPILQTSEAEPNPGRFTQGANRDLATTLAADTTYDSRGLANVVTDAWATAGAPSTTLLLPTTAVPSRTRYTFDGAGRQTTATYDVDQQPKWTTITSYAGDRTTTVPPAGDTPSTTVTDARGNTTSLIRYTTPSLTGPSQTATYTYDKANHLSQVADSVSCQRRAKTDPLLLNGF